VEEGSNPVKYVLVVDDEPQIVAITASILTTKGYNVLTAHGGMAALQKIRGRENEIELLITDVVMPDLNGPHLAAELVRIIPGLRIIFMSGWEPHVIAHEGAYGQGYPTLPKPFTASALLQMVSQVLNEAPEAGSIRPQSSPGRT
jgi:DNA-binding NtrC family response regulator